MRKRLVTPIPHSRVPLDEGGLDIASLGLVEITSEDKACPIEFALQPGKKEGWRAAEPGPQIIRLLFDQPQRLKRIWLVFEETEIQRTQEFVLRWSPDRGRSRKLSASNGISVHPGQYERVRTTPWASPT